MSGKREQNKRKNRQAILDAAQQLFIQRGFEETRIDDLAHAAGIGKGTVYRYFASKETILLELIADLRVNIHQQFAEINDPTAPVAKQLLALFMCQFDFIENNPELARIMFRESMFPSKKSVEQRNQVDIEYLNAVTTILRHGQQRGELRQDVDLLTCTLQMYSQYLTIVSGWFIGYSRDHADVHESLHRTILLNLSGCASEPFSEHYKMTSPHQNPYLPLRCEE